MDNCIKFNHISSNGATVSIQTWSGQVQHQNKLLGWVGGRRSARLERVSALLEAQALRRPAVVVLFAMRTSADE